MGFPNSVSPKQTYSFNIRDTLITGTHIAGDLSKLISATCIGTGQVLPAGASALTAIVLDWTAIIGSTLRTENEPDRYSRLKFSAYIIPASYVWAATTGCLSYARKRVVAPLSDLATRRNERKQQPDSGYSNIVPYRRWPIREE